MKLLLVLCAAFLPALAQQSSGQQGFDFKSLDKLGANAKSTTNVTLEGDSLKLATSMLNDDDDGAQLQSIVKHLKAIYVRSFEYAKPGQYRPADLTPLRAYVNSLHWTKIVDVRDDSETTEIYLQPLPNNRLGGLAVISAESAEVTVVFIQGDLDLSDIGKLSGNLGIPELGIYHGGKNDDKSTPQKNNEKKDR